MIAMRVYLPGPDCHGVAVGRVRDALGRRYTTVRRDTPPGVKPSLITVPDDEVVVPPPAPAQPVAHTSTGQPLYLIGGRDAGQ